MGWLVFDFGEYRGIKLSGKDKDIMSPVEWLAEVLITFRLVDEVRPDVYEKYQNSGNPDMAGELRDIQTRWQEFAWSGDSEKWIELFLWRVSKMILQEGGVPHVLREGRLSREKIERQIRAMIHSGGSGSRVSRKRWVVGRDLHAFVQEHSPGEVVLVSPEGLVERLEAAELMMAEHFEHSLARAYGRWLPPRKEVWRDEPFDLWLVTSEAAQHIETVVVQMGSRLVSDNPIPAAFESVLETYPKAQLLEAPMRGVSWSAIKTLLQGDPERLKEAWVVAPNEPAAAYPWQAPVKAFAPGAPPYVSLQLLGEVASAEALLRALESRLPRWARTNINDSRFNVALINPFSAQATPYALLVEPLMDAEGGEFVGLEERVEEAAVTLSDLSAPMSGSGALVFDASGPGEDGAALETPTRLEGEPQSLRDLASRWKLADLKAHHLVAVSPQAISGNPFLEGLRAGPVSIGSITLVAVPETREQMQNLLIEQFSQSGARRTVVRGYGSRQDSDLRLDVFLGIARAMELDVRELTLQEQQAFRPYFQQLVTNLSGVTPTTNALVALERLLARLRAA